MTATQLPDPFRRLSWLDRRRWSRRARQVVRDFEAKTLADLRSLAGSGAELDWISERQGAIGLPATGSPNSGSPTAGSPATVSPAAVSPAAVSPAGAAAVTAPGLAGPVEFSAGGKRVVAAAVWAPAWESLVVAWRGAAVTLAGAGRYHRSWVLRFRVAGAAGPEAGAQDPKAGAVREFVLLASRVRLIDHWGGQLRDAGLLGLPVAPAALT